MLDFCLDLSTRTGWAAGAPGANRPPLYGLWVLPRLPTMIARDLQIGYRMSCLAAKLEDAIAVHKPDRVVFEAPLHLADGSSRLLIALAGVVEMICCERKIRCEEAHVQAVRALVLGRGRGVNPKARVMKFCAEQGWTPADDNVGDALVLLRYCHTMQRTRLLV